MSKLISPISIIGVGVFVSKLSLASCVSLPPITCATVTVRETHTQSNYKIIKAEVKTAIDPQTSAIVDGSLKPGVMVWMQLRESKQEVKVGETIQGIAEPKCNDVHIITTDEKSYIETDFRLYDSARHDFKDKKGVVECSKFFSKAGS